MASELFAPVCSRRFKGIDVHHGAYLGDCLAHRSCGAIWHPNGSVKPIFAFHRDRETAFDLAADTLVVYVQHSDSQEKMTP